MQASNNNRPSSSFGTNRGMARVNYNQNNVNFENQLQMNQESEGQPAFSARPDQCELFRICQEFVQSLGWEKCFFAPRHNRCYCKDCYSPAQPNVIVTGGDTYVVPREWTGFGLSVDPALADYHKLWTEWIVTYHGTSINAAQSILVNRHFLIPGDKLFNGTLLGIRPGHIPGKKHIYTSPSIRYSSLTVYSVLNDFTASSGKKYKVQLVLQCRQKSGTFSIQAETVGRGKDPICNFISNDKIEYFTEIRASLVPYRLLVNMKEV